MNHPAITTTPTISSMPPGVPYMIAPARIATHAKPHTTYPSSLVLIAADVTRKCRLRLR
jgi:hypothetical protein